MGGGGGVEETERRIEMDLATEKAKKTGIGWVSARGELEPGERGRRGGGGREGGRERGRRTTVQA